MGSEMCIRDRMWNGLYLRMKRIADYVDRGGKIVLVDHTVNNEESVDWGERLYSRKRNYDAQVEKGKADLVFGQLFPNDVDKIKRATLPGTPTIYQRDIKSPNLTLGDSHAISAWIEGSKCSRNDGMTLNGAINRGFDTYIDEMNMKDYHRLRLYMGNIDVRHHLCRLHANAEEACFEAEKLASNYVHEALRIKNKYKWNSVEIVELLPIEHESRRLPKSGFYKDQPFWGSAQERMLVRDAFNQKLRQLRDEYGGFSIIEWPSEYSHCIDVTVPGTDVSGIFKERKEEDITFKKGMLRFGVMEKPHSVHVAPSFYLWSIV